MSHSCTPNCQAVIMACGGRLTIALYTLRHVHEGEGRQLLVIQWGWGRRGPQADEGGQLAVNSPTSLKDSLKASTCASHHPPPLQFHGRRGADV